MKKLKGIGLLIFLGAMAGIVGNKINSIQELTTAGWIFLFAALVLMIACVVGFDRIAVRFVRYAKISEDTKLNQPITSHENC